MAGSDRSGPATPRLFVAVTGHLAVNVLLRPQLASLTAAGWEVHVVCAPGPLDAAAVDSVHAVHGLPMSRSVSPWRDVRSMLQLARLLRAERPVVVVGSTPKAALVSMVGARLARVPVRVFQVRGAPWEGATGRRATLTRLADRVAARSATDVLAVSSSLADVLVAAGVVRRRPRVLLNGGSKGVDTSVFTPDPQRAYDPAAPVVGFAGRLSIDKGIGEILDVVETVRRTVPGLVVQLVGDVDAAQPIPADLVDRLVRSPAVDWRPAVPLDEMPALVSGWDLLLLPSQREGLPNVVLEAAACGVPTVAWDVTGVRDCVEDGRTGRLVPRGDLGAMTAAVLECLEPDRHARMAAFAVPWVREHFDAALVSRAFTDYLADVCREHGQVPPAPTVRS